jgi:TPR repeat protein
MLDEGVWVVQNPEAAAKFFEIAAKRRRWIASRTLPRDRFSESAGWTRDA